MIDGRDFSRCPISQLVLGVLAEARAFVAGRPDAKWFRPASSEPTQEQCGEIVQVLRPDFEFFEPPRAHAARLSTEVKRYTEEQYIALDAMEANPRVVFAGPAGTGKTLLAIEAARRSRATRRRVLFVCYNRLLGQWLAEQTGGLRPEVTTSTLHGHMMAVAAYPPVPAAGQDPVFWETTLPGLATDALLADETGEYVYDEIVLDEAPDILRSEYLDFLDLSVRGGLAAGRWRLFGDFEKQAVYGAANLSLQQVLRDRGGSAPVYSLRVNCRNVPRIAALMNLLGGLAPDYSRVLRPDDGVEPTVYHYRSRPEELAHLAKVLDGFLAEGFAGHEIIVLSPRAGSECAAAALEASEWRGRLSPLGQGVPGQVRYVSIRAFKGMESPAVVVTDANSITGGDAESLFYVAISRALHRLAIIVDERVRQEMREVLLHGPARQ